MTKEKSEKIRYAAVQGPLLFFGKSHSDCIAKAATLGMRLPSTGSAQGFLTSKGRFVDRQEAAKIAVRAGQVLAGVQVLFSDCLTSSQADIPHEYDENKGYHLPGEW